MLYINPEEAWKGEIDKADFTLLVSDNLPLLNCEKNCNYSSTNIVSCPRLCVTICGVTSRWCQILQAPAL